MTKLYFLLMLQVHSGLVGGSEPASSSLGVRGLPFATSSITEGGGREEEDTLGLTYWYFIGHSKTRAPADGSPVGHSPLVLRYGGNQMLVSGRLSTVVGSYAVHRERLESASSRFQHSHL